MESLVIGFYHSPVNMSLSLAHTARQTIRAGFRWNSTLLVALNLSSVRRVKSSQGHRRGTCGGITSFNFIIRISGKTGNLVIKLYNLILQFFSPTILYSSQLGKLPTARALSSAVEHHPCMQKAKTFAWERWGPRVRIQKRSFWFASNFVWRNSRRVHKWNLWVCDSKIAKRFLLSQSPLIIQHHIQIYY